MLRQYELVERVLSYDKNADKEALIYAYEFSEKAHEEQVRASGDPYFSHPLEVAGILADLKLDTATIITALLHDVVEDTTISLADIEKQFGREIARLVDGVTKLSKLALPSDKSLQAENFRKLVIAMSEDIRVLLVKLADRLHNMRTLHHKADAEKRKKTALETFEIYAPLAERIGIHQIKDELEDLAFRETHPEARESIIKRLGFLREKGENIIPRILSGLKDVLDKNKIAVSLFGREKSPYSIWKKMQHKNVAFEELCDIMAFRVIVESSDDCYKTLGVLHSNYPVLPGRFKDYISTPKPNGYQSIHTALIGPENHRIEVQIRTQSMHEIAEWGVAAHWRYKNDDAGNGKRLLEGRQYRWLQEMMSLLEESSGAEEFLEHTRLEMFQDQVFCFSPKGDLVALPRGSTPVDFAFAVHSEVGRHCVGARINGRLLPLKTELHNGDQIEIITSKTQTPSPDWEKFVVTGKAKASIRKFVRSENRKQFIDLGHSMIVRAFRQLNLPFSEKALEEILREFSVKSLSDLYCEVGEGNVSIQHVLKKMFPDREVHHHTTEVEDELPHLKVKTETSSFAIPIKGLIPGMALHYAGCCHPLPGDRIVGIVTTGKGVTIHTIDCEALEKFSDEMERWLDVSWDESHAKVEKFVGRVHIILANKPGSLAAVTNIIGKSNVNITNVKIINRKNDFFEMLVDVEVESLQQLTIVMAALRASPTILSVERARS